MFSIRSILVSLGFFGVFYCLLSLLVACAWRWTKFLRRIAAKRLAQLLFGLRIFPLVASAVITLAFALPAFLLLESGVVDEDLGTLLFGVCTLLLIAAGLFRVMTAQARTVRVVSEWLDGASLIDSGATVPTFQAKPGTPALLLFGVFVPKILVSETATASLSGDELRVSVRHEIEHIRSRDNLKKLIVHCCPFPGMKGLESAWQQTAELAADDAAVSSQAEALDLAAALIKLSELAPIQNAPAFTTGLTSVSLSVPLRVERLLEWHESKTQPAASPAWLLLPLIATGGYVAANYGYALLLTHRLTEWFVH